MLALISLCLAQGLEKSILTKTTECYSQMAHILMSLRAGNNTTLVNALSFAISGNH